MEEFLTNKCEVLTFIGHPLPYSTEKYSFLKLYLNGSIEYKRSFNVCIPNREFIIYMKDIIATIYFILTNKRKYDLFIGVDPLNAILGLLFKKLGIVRQVVFYTIDYSPVRFSNTLLNTIYHKVDSICAIHSDYLWNLSPFMIKAREKKGIRRDIHSQITVPIGIHFKNIEILPFEYLEQNTIAYVGGLYNEYGFELIIKAFPLLVKKFPDIKIKVISFDIFSEEWKDELKRVGVKNHFEILGYIKNDDEVEQILRRCRCGIAPYRDDPLSFKRYTDVTKPKTYMSCGLPVIITHTPPIAREIERENAGITINYDEKELVDAITKLFSDDIYYKKCRENAIRLASKYDWDNIFKNATSFYLKNVS